MSIVKKAALEAVEAIKPVAVVFGRVASVSPLSVRVDQKLALTRDMLTVAAGTRRIEEVQPGLQAGDEVILLRMQGGQKYIVVDRIG